MEDEQVIRQQMQDTRTALSEKLETLENKVTETVVQATDAVSETVTSVKDTVQETVATVKDSVQETVCTVKDSVEDGMQTVKSWFNLSQHVERRPWMVMAGAVCAGYCAEAMLTAKSAESNQGSAAGQAPERHHGNGHRGQRRSTAKSVLSEFGPEISQLKSLALGALLGVAREMVLQATPPSLGQQLKELFDSATKKLGGEPLAAEDFGSRPGAHYGSLPESRMGGVR